MLDMNHLGRLHGAAGGGQVHGAGAQDEGGTSRGHGQYPQQTQLQTQ